MSVKSNLLLCICLSTACTMPSFAVSPTVTNVQACQEQNEARKVKVTYTLTDPDSASVYITLTISTDNGATYTITPSLATGDIGWVKPGGSRTIYWDAKSQYPQGKWTQCKAKITADDSTGGVYPGEMINIPAGSFLMGNSNVGADATYRYSEELPQHSVYLSAYSIGKYEVTRGEYRKFINAGGYTNQSFWSSAGWSWKVSNNRSEPYYWAAVQNWGTPPGSFTQTDNHPVVGVTYYEAEAYCKWAGGRLPTEAEWERAARWTGSSPRVYPWGDTWNVNYCNNYEDTVFPHYQTSPVGSYSAYGSPSGCQDMAGNVWEWCSDWYSSTYYSSSPSSNPTGPASGSCRVLRGGGWFHSAGNGCRCAYRDNSSPSSYGSNLGFRMAR